MRVWLALTLILATSSPMAGDDGCNELKGSPRNFTDEGCYIPPRLHDGARARMNGARSARGTASIATLELISDPRIFNSLRPGVSFGPEDFRHRPVAKGLARSR